jgi:hypothetical protein
MKWLAGDGSFRSRSSIVVVNRCLRRRANTFDPCDCIRLRTNVDRRRTTTEEFPTAKRRRRVHKSLEAGSKQETTTTTTISKNIALSFRHVVVLCCDVADDAGAARGDDQTRSDIGRRIAVSKHQATTQHVLVVLERRLVARWCFHSEPEPPTIAPSRHSGNSCCAVSSSTKPKHRQLTTCSDCHCSLQQRATTARARR